MASQDPFNRSHQHESTEINYFTSLSDLLIGLIFLFIIMLMSFALQYRGAEHSSNRQLTHLTEERDMLQTERDGLEAERDLLRKQTQSVTALGKNLASREEDRQELLALIEERMRQSGVEVVLLPEQGILRLPEETLFQSARADFSEEGEKMLGAMAQILGEVLPCYSGARYAEFDLVEGCPTNSRPILETILIEGHTDDLPILNSEYSDNWELALARAVSTYQWLVDQEQDLLTLANVKGEPLIGISGYESLRPVEDNENDEQRRENRRIDLRFLVATPTAIEVENSLKGVLQ